MQFPTAKADNFHDNELSHQVAASLHSRLGSKLRDLKLFKHPDGVILHGRASTYYGKQLAQHVVMKIHGLAIVANEIEVR